MSQIYTIFLNESEKSESFCLRREVLREIVGYLLNVALVMSRHSSHTFSNNLFLSQIQDLEQKPPNSRSEYSQKRSESFILCFVLLLSENWTQVFIHSFAANFFAFTPRKKMLVFIRDLSLLWISIIQNLKFSTNQL